MMSTVVYPSGHQPTGARATALSSGRPQTIPLQLLMQQSGYHTNLSAGVQNPMGSVQSSAPLQYGWYHGTGIHPSIQQTAYHGVPMPHGSGQSTLPHGPIPQPSLGSVQSMPQAPAPRDLPAAQQDDPDSLWSSYSVNENPNSHPSRGISCNSHVYLNQPPADYTPLPDDDFGTMRTDPRQHIENIYNAMRHPLTSGDKWAQNQGNRIIKRGWSQKHVQATATNLLDRIIDMHEHRCRIPLVNLLLKPTL